MKLFKTRQASQEPPLDLTHDLSVLVKNDRYSIADMDGVKITMEPWRSVCQRDHVFIITSAPNNKQLRDAVRRHLRNKAGVIFLLGDPSQHQLTLMEDEGILEKENVAFGDILQGDFVDSYPHLSHKVIMAYLWINSHCKRLPKFLIKMDDDTRIDYSRLAASLNSQDPAETNIYCPSVLRNQKLWRHKAAPVMGKWAYLNDNFTRNLLPDYCNGNLYAVTPKVGVLLAQGARHVFHHYHAEDLYLNGLVAERIPEISHRSLSPFLGNTIWDGVLTHCPLFSAAKHLFNPMVLGGGEANGVGDAVKGDTIEYFHNPYFFFCISIEHLNYEILRPYGLFIEALNHVCSRN